MTFLAYDPARLAALRARMVHALGELEPIRSDDPLAADAVHAVRAIADDLSLTWLPVVDRILREQPLRAAVPRGHDLDAVENALARTLAMDRGWSVAVDPMPDGRMTIAEARALAAWLAERDPARLLDDADALHHLAARLPEVASRTDLAAAFLAGFPDWPDLVDQLAGARTVAAAGLQPRTRVPLAELDAVLAGIGGLFRERRSGPAVGGRVAECVDPIAARPWIDRVSPLAVALLLPSVGLRGDELAVVADHLLRRPADPLDDVRGPNTIDLVLRLVAEDADACTRFLLRIADHPGDVFHHAADLELVHQVVLAGTHPDRIDATTAGRIVPPILGWFESTNTTRPDPGAFLVDLIVPWTMQLSPGSDAWALSIERRRELMAFVLRSDAALELFIDRQARVVDGARRSLHAGDAHTADELVGYLGMIGDLVVNERVREATERRRAWDMVCNVATLATTLLPGVALGVGATIAIDRIHDHFAVDPAEVEHDAFWGADAALTQGAATISTALYNGWVAEETLPEDFPPPPHVDLNSAMPSVDYMQDLWHWFDLLPGGTNGHLANEVRFNVYVLLNPATMGAHSNHA